MEDTKVREDGLKEQVYDDIVGEGSARVRFVNDADGNTKEIFVDTGGGEFEDMTSVFTAYPVVGTMATMVRITRQFLQIRHEKEQSAGYQARVIELEDRLTERGEEIEASRAEAFGYLTQLETVADALGPILKKRNEAKMAELDKVIQSLDSEVSYRAENTPSVSSLRQKLDNLEEAISDAETEVRDLGSEVDDIEEPDSEDLQMLMAEAVRIMEELND